MTTEFLTSDLERYNYLEKVSENYTKFCEVICFLIHGTSSVNINEFKSCSNEVGYSKIFIRNLEGHVLNSNYPVKSVMGIIWLLESIEKNEGKYASTKEKSLFLALLALKDERTEYDEFVDISESVDRLKKMTAYIYSPNFKQLLVNVVLSSTNEYLELTTQPKKKPRPNYYIKARSWGRVRVY